MEQQDTSSEHTLVQNGGLTSQAASVAATVEAETSEQEACPNCGAGRVGEYCQGCGQHYLQRRLTLRVMWREFAERFLKLERGLLRTFREMTTDPGGLIRRYIGGQRRSYLNPFSYVVIGSVLAVFISQVAGVSEEMVNLARNNLYEQIIASPQALPPAFVQLYSDFVLTITKYSLYITLGMAIPFALLLRLLFARVGYNLAEHFVFALFCFGHVAIVWSLLYLLRWIFSIPIDIQILSMLSMVGYIAMCSYAAFQFYGERLAAVLKMTLGFAVSYAVVMGVVFGGLIVYLIVTPNVIRGGSDWTLLQAAEQNALPVAAMLLEDGTDVNETTRQTPLHAAVESGHARMVDLLLGHGADINAVDYLNRTPLTLAIHAEQADLARRLLQANPDPNIAMQNENTPLIEAINHGYPDIARWLIEHGADVNAQRGRERATALNAAAYEGDHATVDLLLRHGADPTIADPDGKTALDLAATEEIAALLRAALATKAEQEK